MIDLHVHTNVSDCPLSISEICRLAKQKSITHLAVTNHDTLKNLSAAVETGRSFNITVIPGIEISAYEFNTQKRVHILGLFIDPDSQSLHDFCHTLLEKRKKNAFLMLEKVQKLGYNISRNEVLDLTGESELIYKQHIMHALMNKGYTDRILGDLHKELFARPSQSHSAGKVFIALEYLDCNQAVKEIKKAHGLAILAHPKMYGSDSFIPDLIQAGLDGIEVFHPSQDENDWNHYAKIANENNLAITGGSDFHGLYGGDKKNESLGCPYLDETDFEKVKSCWQNKTHAVH